MGLFDKFREVVDTAKDTLDKVVDSALSSNEPTVERYRGVILVLLSTVDRLTKENIKTYYKVKYNEICDEVALDKALAKFEAVTEPKQGQTWYKLTFNQWQKSSVKTQTVTADEIYDICFAEYKDEVKDKFNKILDVLRESPKLKFLEEALYKLEWQLNLPVSLYYPHVRLAGQAQSEVMIERFFAEDPTVKTLVIQGLCKYLCEYRGLERVYAVVLRANHFEQFDKISKEYQTISLEDCYNAAKNSPTYQNQNNETSPFYTDDFIKRIAQKIQECSFFDNSSDLDWKKWASKNPRFLDAACFYTLQKIAELFLDSETANIEKAVDMIATYISNKNQQ